MTVFIQEVPNNTYQTQVRSDRKTQVGTIRDKLTWGGANHSEDAFVQVENVVITGKQLLLRRIFMNLLHKCTKMRRKRRKSGGQ